MAWTSTMPNLPGDLLNFPPSNPSKDPPCVSFIGIVDFSQEARWLYMTDSVADLLGFEPKELIGRPSLELVHPDEFPRVRQLHYDTIQQDKAAVLVYLRLRHKDPYKGYILCGISRTVVHNVLVGSVSFASPGAKALHNASTAQEITVISKGAHNFEFRRWHDPSPMPPSPTLPPIRNLPPSPSSSADSSWSSPSPPPPPHSSTHHHHPPSTTGAGSSTYSRYAEYSNARAEPVPVPPSRGEYRDEYRDEYEYSSSSSNPRRSSESASVGSGSGSGPGSVYVERSPSPITGRPRPMRRQSNSTASASSASASVSAVRTPAMSSRERDRERYSPVSQSPSTTRSSPRSPHSYSRERERGLEDGVRRSPHSNSSHHSQSPRSRSGSPAPLLPTPTSDTDPESAIIRGRSDEGVDDGYGSGGSTGTYRHHHQPQHDYRDDRDRSYEEHGQVYQPHPRSHPHHSHSEHHHDRDRYHDQRQQRQQGPASPTPRPSTPVITFPHLPSKSFRTAFILDRFSLHCTILYCSNDLLVQSTHAIGRSFFDFVSPKDEGIVKSWIECVKGWGVNERGQPSDGGFGFGRFGLLVCGRESVSRLPEPSTPSRHRQGSTSGGRHHRDHNNHSSSRHGRYHHGPRTERERERDTAYAAYQREIGEQFAVDAIFSAHSDGLMVILRRAQN